MILLKLFSELEKKMIKLENTPIIVSQGIFLSTGSKPVFGRRGFPVFGKPGEFVLVTPPTSTAVP